MKSRITQKEVWKAKEIILMKLLFLMMHIQTYVSCPVKSTKKEETFAAHCLASEKSYFWSKQGHNFQTKQFLLSVKTNKEGNLHEHSHCFILHREYFWADKERSPWRHYFTSSRDMNQLSFYSWANFLLNQLTSPKDLRVNMKRWTAKTFLVVVLLVILNEKLMILTAWTLILINIFVQRKKWHLHQTKYQQETASHSFPS